ncbi:MAG: hypothetical protein IH933_12980 [Euryarchaeota archaeon]|nr:hypothetical protein [Euryarchaeota archaeon]
MTDEDLLSKHAEKWYEATRSMHRYAVDPPEDVASGRRYCSTLGEVRNRLEFWYE